jgi:ACS family glucarate transporter-like MFS transporter
VGLLAAICFLGHFNRVSMAVAADLEIMPEYGISPTQMGFVYSAFLFAYTLTMIPGGWLIDEHGPRLALAAMCMLSALFVALTGVVGLATGTAAVALAALFLVRGLMGAVSAPMHPAAANAIALGIPSQGRSAANGIVTGAALLGVASTFIIFGKLVEWFGWPVAFLEVAMVTLALGELWRFGAGDSVARSRADTTPPTAEHGQPDFEVLPSLRKNKNLILLTLSYACVGYFQYLFFYWMHYYFEDVLMLSSERAKWYAAIPPLAMAIGMPLGGWLSDRLMMRFGWRAARTYLAVLAMGASAGLLLLGIRASDPAWIVIWLSLALGVLGMAEGPFWVTAVEVGRGRGGFSAGVFNTGGNAGGILAPVITPWVSDTLGYGWEAGIGLGSAVGLFGAVLWLGIDPTNDDVHEVELAPDGPAPQLAPGPTN